MMKVLEDEEISEDELRAAIRKGTLAGTLVPVLDDATPSPVPVHLVHPQARLVAPKIRAFVDFAAPRLKGVLDRLG